MRARLWQGKARAGPAPGATPDRAPLGTLNTETCEAPGGSVRLQVDVGLYLP